MILVAAGDGMSVSEHVGAHVFHRFLLLQRFLLFVDPIRIVLATVVQVCRYASSHADVLPHKQGGAYHACTGNILGFVRAECFGVAV